MISATLTHDLNTISAHRNWYIIAIETNFDTYEYKYQLNRILWPKMDLKNCVDKTKY